MTLPVILSIVAVIGVIAFLVWWLVFETEGVFLGQRAVIWLYDLYARRYDDITQVDEIDEHLYLAQPVMAALAPDTMPLVLDVGTGTGRLPLALCQHAAFEGHIVGLDLSSQMLAQAVTKMTENGFDDYVTWVRSPAERLPFADGAFDLVTCLQTLEFTPQPEATLAELVRVLRPGGVLLLSLRQDTPWYFKRVWSPEYMQAQLSQQGLLGIRFETWLVTYQQVWAVKPESPAS